MDGAQMTGRREVLVAAIVDEMQNVLGARPMTATDDFFLCGGDSLLAVELVARLADRLVSSSAARQLRADLLTGVFDDATHNALAAIVELADAEIHP
jgi:hypothetical protein